MAYQAYNVYGAACDQCGRLAAGDASEADPTRDMADETAFDLGWQIIGDGHGKTLRHYCPDHWHVACAGCGMKRSGNPDALEQDGWTVDDANPLSSRCAACMKREAK